MEPEDHATVRAMHAEIWSLIQRGDGQDIHKAAQLCGSLPPCCPETAPLISHVLIATAFELEQAGSLEEAKALYRRLHNEPHADAHHRSNAAFRLGLTLLQTGHQHEAVQALRQAFETNGAPTYQLTAALHLAHLLAEAQAHHEALRVIEKALVLPFDNPEMKLVLWFNRLTCQARLQLLQHEDTSAAADLPAPSEIDDGTAGAWVQAAFALEENGYNALSRLLYEGLLRVPVLPTGVRANCHYRLGLVLDRLYAFDDAASHFRASVDCPDPSPVAQAEARHRLAELHLMLEDYEHALNDFDELRSLPDLGSYKRAEAHLKYATCLLRLQRLDEALEELERCRNQRQGAGTDIEVKADILIAEIAERRRDWRALRECLTRIMQHPAAEPLTKTAALSKLQKTPKR